LRGKTAVLSGAKAPPQDTGRPSARPVPGSAPGVHSASLKEGPGARIPAALSSLFSQLKLPPDGLSVSIVSFAQFFSLPLKASLLARIRRQAVSGPSGSGAPLPGGGSDEKAVPAIREARSLACIAALDKGLELSAESLERYARMVSGQPLPPEHSGSEGGDKGAGGNQGNAGADPGNDRLPADSGNGRGSAGEGEKDGRDPGKGKDEGGGAEALRSLAGKLEEGEPLLGLLNRLPGKNGKRWLAIPLPMEEGGIRLQATLRILLSPRAGEAAGIPGEVEQMALEVNGARRRWLFSYRPGSLLQAALWPEPEAGERAALEKELAESLGFSAGELKISGLNPVFAPDCRNDLSSVREEV
jgi:hypothetical protein